MSGAVAVVRTGAVAAVLAAAGQAPAALTRLECDKANRLRHADDRAAYIAAHQLGRLVVALGCGAAVPELSYRQRCSECGSNTHGAPWIEDAVGRRFHVSLSHTRGVVAAVAGAEHRVDVEALGACAAPLPGALTAQEEARAARAADPAAARARTWTVKEALVKHGALTLEQACSTDVGPIGSAGELRLGSRTWHYTAWDDVAGAIATVVSTSPGLLRRLETREEVRV